MKRTTTLILLSVFALLTVATSCKKYEDGPALSLLTKKQRLCRTWVVKSISVGGFSVEDDSFDNYTYDFQKNGDATVVQDGVTTTGKWSFTHDKEDLTIDANGESSTVEIRRLTNKELWIEDKHEDGSDYILKLEEK